MNIYEAIGVSYTILGTILFTAQLIYCSAKGLNRIRHSVARGQAEERQDLERAASIKNELAKLG